MNYGAAANGRHPGATQVPLADRHDHDAVGHSVQFYGEDGFLLDELSRFIGSALGAGDAAIVVATKAHRDGLARRLKARGLDVAPAAKQGRYVSLDAAETLSEFMVDGRPDAARFTRLIGGFLEAVTAAAAGGHSQVVAFGEMVALLWAQGKPEAALELERLWNDLAGKYNFNLRCAYPIGLFSRSRDGEAISKICAAHSRVIPAESYTSLVDEDERLLSIAILQQKAQALENEIEERKNAEKSLEHAVAARDEFLSVAAHELKTPITSLRGFAQLLLRDIRQKRDVSPERLESALNAIEQQTGKLTHLVAHLLDTAQIEAGKLRIEPVRSDLVPIVRSVLARQPGNITHKFVLDAPEHLTAMVDPVRFEQVVANLLDNAVKFSPRGGTVHVGLARGEDRSTRLYVSDEGLGISTEQSENIFDRFHQAHSARHLSGLGLGLYITREIVQLHGGRIWVESLEGGGSRFVVSLPI